MIILLQGGSKLARSVIAAKFAAKHPGWQHLPAEEVGAATSAMGFDLFSEPSVLAMLACTCAQEVEQKDKVNLILTCDAELPILDNFRSECGKDGVAVHLLSKKGGKAEGKFDHELDASASAEKACKELGKFVKE